MVQELQKVIHVGGSIAIDVAAGCTPAANQQEQVIYVDLHVFGQVGAAVRWADLVEGVAAQICPASIDLVPERAVPALQVAAAVTGSPANSPVGELVDEVEHGDGSISIEITAGSLLTPVLQQQKYIDS